MAGLITIGIIMQTKQKDEHEAESEKPARPQHQTIIGEQVLQSLGQPTSYHQVQVRKLWGGRFRVNVFVGADLTSAVVAHSFFLVTDDNGQIINATPSITKQY
jgi:hypothetical protein